MEIILSDYLVDDTLRNIQVLGTILRKEGYQIHVAQDGLEALKVVETAQPDLILLDVMMPKLDGFETCRRLKQNQSTRDIPVIFITARDDTKDILEGFQIGCVDYITKPFQSEVVLARASAHLKISKMARMLEVRNRFIRQTLFPQPPKRKQRRWFRSLGRCRLNPKGSKPPLPSTKCPELVENTICTCPKADNPSIDWPPHLRSDIRS